MFFVFGPSGQMYRGGVENLSRVAPVRRVPRTQALRTWETEVERTGAEGAETATAAGAAPPPAPGAAGLYSHNRSEAPAAALNLRMQDAVTAYVQTEQGPRAQRQPLTQVRDVMRSRADTVTVAPELRVNDAWQALAERHVAQAPVLDAQGQVVGLLLRADMAPLDLLPAPGAVRDAIALARRPVAEVMFSPVPTVAQDTALRSVASVLLDTDLPGLPVTDEAGQLIGFVSRNDILRAVAGEPPLDLWSGAVQAQK